MTAFATMLALAPLAVTGGGGGVGGAFISGPLAIVVIGGLFTSTLLTLILVPVLYSLTSRFSGLRATRDLDAVLDAAEDRRFKPLGLRGTGEVIATPPSASREFAMTLTIEPAEGNAGDPKVLEALRGSGLSVEPLPGSRMMRIEIPRLLATSESDAAAKALDMVRKLVPAEGYHLSEPEEIAKKELAVAAN